MSERKIFYRTALTVAAPIIAQNLISTLVSSADTVMLGYVSQDAMSASSLANQLQFVMMMAMYGLSAAASVLASQYWGRKDTDTIERVLGLGLRFAVGIAAVFAVLAIGFPRLVMRCFTPDEAIIREGVTYLRIIGFSYVFVAVSQVYVAVVRSVEKVVMPTLVYALSLVINVSMNATFIFGLFGAPKLGLVGVALGTVTARVSEVVVCLLYARYGRAVRLRAKYLFARAGVLMKDFLSVSLPSLVNDVAWSLAASMYSVVMGHLGSDVVAANAVAAMAVNIGAMVCRGFASGATIVVSKPLGAGDRETAKRYGSRMLRLCIGFGVLSMLVIWALIPAMRAVYAGKLSETALTLLGGMVILRGVQLVGENINTCLICGCFRAGGDAKFGMVLDLCYMWLVEVPLLLIAAFVIKLPTMWVYAVICFDEFGKMTPAVMHYLSFKWLNDITRDKEELGA